MFTAQEKVAKELSETEAVIEEFKQKLTRTLLKEKDRLHELADRDAKNILAGAYQEAAKLGEKARQDAEAVTEQAKAKAALEKDAVLAKASSQAEQVVKIAEEKSRNEARERTKKEVESILRKAKEDATKQAAKVLQTAREEAAQVSKQMLAETENEVHKLTSSANELHEKAAEELTTAQKKTSEAVEQALTAARQAARAQAEKEAQEIISAAKIAAQKEGESLLAAAITKSKQLAVIETDAILAKAKNEAEEIVSQAKNKVRTQIEESSRLMQEIQQKMHQVMAVPGAADLKLKMETLNKTPVPPETVISKNNPDNVSENPAPAKSTQNKIDSLFSEDENRTHSGKLKIDIAPPARNENLAALEQQLMKNTSLRVIAKGGAEDGSAWLEIDISSPLPLIDILRKTPCVKDVVGGKNYIIVALKSS